MKKINNLPGYGRGTAVLLFLIVLCTGPGCLAQDDIVIGRRHTLFSSVLAEQREYWVSLPADYGRTEYAPAAYPVIYVLDGDSHFPTLTGIRNALSKGPYAQMPQAIVVGILNTNRSRDLTPAIQDPQRTDATTVRFDGAGGNDKFIRFLENELFPAVEKQYRTDPYRVLIGHSFGGLTALNIFLHHTGLFNAYLAIDPSLWWDDMALIRQADTLLGRKDFTGKALFVSSANKILVPRDTTTEMKRTIARFGQQLKRLQPKGLDWHWQYYENEDHSSIPIPAGHDGLRYIFRDFQLQVKQAFEDPDMVVRHFDAISARLGHTFRPLEAWLDELAEVTEKRKHPEAALRLFELNTVYHPHSRRTWQRYAEALQKSGQAAKAQECLKKAERL